MKISPTATVIYREMIATFLSLFGTSNIKEAPSYTRLFKFILNTSTLDDIYKSIRRLGVIKNHYETIEDNQGSVLVLVLAILGYFQCKLKKDWIGARLFFDFVKEDMGDAFWHGMDFIPTAEDYYLVTLLAADGTCHVREAYYFFDPESENDGNFVKPETNAPFDFTNDGGIIAWAEMIEPYNPE